jgi:hypothetical protein
VANTDPPTEAGTSRRHRRREREARRNRSRFVATFVVAAIATAGAALWFTGALDGSGASGHPTVAALDPVTTTPHTTTTVDTRPKCRSPLTTTAPLKLWIGGDSLAGSLGPSLGNLAAATGVVAPVYDSRVSSGLANPKFFDWPKHATQEMTRLQPEVVAFIIGTNDYVVPTPTTTGSTGSTGSTGTTTTTAPGFGATTTTTTTAAAASGTGSQPAWRAAYAAEVEQMLQVLIGPGPVGRTVYWIGAPILKDTRMDAGAAQVSEVAREVIARHPEATYVDAHALFADANGKYTSTMTALDGKRVVIRAGDGVHLTPEGGDKLAEAVMNLLDARCHVLAQAVPGVKQPVIQTKGSTAIPGTGRTPATGSRSSSGVTTPTSTATTPTTAPTASTAPPVSAPPSTPATSTPTSDPGPPTT